MRDNTGVDNDWVDDPKNEVVMPKSLAERVAGARTALVGDVVELDIVQYLMVIMRKGGEQ